MMPIEEGVVALQRREDAVGVALGDAEQPVHVQPQLAPAVAHVALLCERLARRIDGKLVAVGRRLARVEQLLDARNERIARAARDHVRAPRLHVGARRRARREREQLADF